MKILVDLVNAWNNFDNEHPGSGIDDFCRYYLVHKKELTSSEPMVGGVIPPYTDALLSKLLGRIAIIHDMYSRLALSQLNIQIEWYHVLQSVFKLKVIRKTELIQHNLMEYSTGMSIIEKLKKKGLISERNDLKDNRAKLIQITEKGQRLIQKCYIQLGKVATLIFKDLSEEDKKLIIHLLKGVEIKHSKLVYKARQQNFDAFIKDHLASENSAA